MEGFIVENEIKITNIVTMLKEVANFSRDVRHIFNDICLEFENKNILKLKDKPAHENFFFEKEKSAIYYEFYVVSNNNTIIGFRLIIAIEYTVDFRRYIDITEQLCIDTKIPLLIVYGCFKPVISANQSSGNIQIIMDACCGFTPKEDEEIDWINFNKESIAFNTDIIVEIKKYITEVQNSDYIEWHDYFSKAKIKYKPLLEIQNHEDIKNLADEIKTMMF